MHCIWSENIYKSIDLHKHICIDRHVYYKDNPLFYPLLVFGETSSIAAIKFEFMIGEISTKFVAVYNWQCLSLHDTMQLFIIKLYVLT